MFEINETMVRKLLNTVDAGLVRGLGEPVPGMMCVEAAISYALGEPHSDGPSCVEDVVRISKIALNDAKGWSSNSARAKGLRRVAIAQLGSKGVVDGKRYLALVAEGTTREIVPIALRAAAKLVPMHASALESAAVRCETEGTRESALAARAYAAAYAADADADADGDAAAAYAADAADAAYAAAAAADHAADAAAGVIRDVILTRLAEIMVRALKECGSPGCDWLWLVDETAASGEAR